VTIPPSRRKRNYFEQLKPELGGILQDIIKGCYEWQKKGLKPPPAVVEATAEFLGSQDRVVRWVDDCCEAVTGEPAAVAKVTTETQKLYNSWREWCDRKGEKPGTMGNFVEALKATKKFRHSPNDGKTQARFHGIRLLSRAKDAI
jgi:putative DNA primase/helicase